MFHVQHGKVGPAVAHRTASDVVRPVVPTRRIVSGEEALDDLVRTLRDDCGFAEATLHNRRRSLTPFRAWLGHVSIDTTNVFAEVDLETKAQMLAACGSFPPSKAPRRRWRDDPPLMQFLR